MRKHNWIESKQGWEDYEQDYPSRAAAALVAQELSHDLNQPIDVVERVDGYPLPVYHLYTTVKPGSRISAQEQGA